MASNSSTILGCWEASTSSGAELEGSWTLTSWYWNISCWHFPKTSKLGLWWIIFRSHSQNRHVMWKNYEPLRAVYSFSGFLSVVAENFVCYQVVAKEKRTYRFLKIVYILRFLVDMLFELQQSRFFVHYMQLKISIRHLNVPAEWVFWKVVCKFAYTDVSFAFFLLIVWWITDCCACVS